MGQLRVHAIFTEPFLNRKGGFDIIFDDQNFHERVSNSLPVPVKAPPRRHGNLCLGLQLDRQRDIAPVMIDQQQNAGTTGLIQFFKDLVQFFA